MKNSGISIFSILLLSIFLMPTSFVSEEEKETEFAIRRKMLVEELEHDGITDERVLAAMLRVKRHLFVPPDLEDEAYENRALPISDEGLEESTEPSSGGSIRIRIPRKTISQPYIVAYMTEVLGLKENDRVLEIGTGSGYQAAILAEIAKEVYTVEISKDLADAARTQLERLGYDNIHVRCGDGFEGWAEFAPFDCIIVTAAPQEAPQELIRQLKLGGRMVMPIGESSGFLSRQELYLLTKTESGIEKKKLLDVSFVPMVEGEK